MNQDAFLQALREQLSALPPQEQARYVEDYRELIGDRMEEGMREQDAVAALGAPAQIAQQILAETPLSTLVKRRLAPTRKLRGWEITLLILGFPLWFPLLVAAAAVVFSLIVASCAVLFSLLAAAASIAVSGPVAAVAGILQLTQGFAGEGLTLLGLGLCLTGLGILLFYAASRLSAAFFRWLSATLRKLFLRKTYQNSV